jgi:hypothetical protein
MRSLCVNSAAAALRITAGFTVACLAGWPVVYAQPVYDGFNVYCTSNMDGTGVCTNMETSRKLQCIIIPGQVIDCKSRSGKSFQCVLFSQYTPNQAEFFCDPAVDQMLGQEVDSAGADAFYNTFPNSL